MTGKTELKTLLEIRDQTGVVSPKLLSLPNLPLEGAHVWEWYSDLDARRQAGFTINALCWSDIRAYFELRRIEPAKWEIDALTKLDDEFLQSRLDKTAGKAATASGMNKALKKAHR